MADTEDTLQAAHRKGVETRSLYRFGYRGAVVMKAAGESPRVITETAESIDGNENWLRGIRAGITGHYLDPATMASRLLEEE